jgi:DNA-binding transcriptional regulator YiaG
MGSWEGGVIMSGEELAETRREMGWSQYVLADVLAIPRSSITHWECNRAPVPSNIASAMKKASRSMVKLKGELGRGAYR